MDKKLPYIFIFDALPKNIHSNTYLEFCISQKEKLARYVELLSDLINPMFDTNFNTDINIDRINKDYIRDILHEYKKILIIYETRIIQLIESGDIIQFHNYNSEKMKIWQELKFFNKIKREMIYKMKLIQQGRSWRWLENYSRKLRGESYVEMPEMTEKGPGIEFQKLCINMREKKAQFLELVKNQPHIKTNVYVEMPKRKCVDRLSKLKEKKKGKISYIQRERRRFGIKILKY
jgi:hypothetical protein